MRSLETAMGTIARYALAVAAQEIAEDGWENYPEIGQDDWRRIGDIMREMAAFPRPEEYSAAYRLLEQRANAEPQEAQPRSLDQMHRDIHGCDE